MTKTVHVGVQYKTGRMCGARDGFIATIQSIELIAWTLTLLGSLIALSITRALAHRS